jgi:phosphate starvation-inducible PhoH-like protein
MNAEIPIQNVEEARVLFGPLDKTAKLFQENFGVRLVHRGDVLKLLGNEEGVSKARAVLENCLRRMRQGHRLTHAEIENMVLGRDQVRHTQSPSPQEVSLPTPGPAGVDSSSIRPSRVQPKTKGQKHYLRAIEKNSVVFAVGPAGTGKTYLAVAAAVEALQRSEFQKIVLARPAVEAGEKLGFLPGDYYAKVNPYLRPLYDALGDMLGPTLTKRYLESEIIEVCPLAYMRGRTLNHSFILLDEAQNTTVSQMRMFLTRMGEGSKIVVTGDVTQVDLPGNIRSGLVDAVQRLYRVKGLTVVQLEREDIVRHRIVQDIVEAYESTQARMPSPEDRGANPVRTRKHK